MEPLRTCIACRRRAVRGDLLRVVLREGQVIPDDRAVFPGRGAWLHPSASCVKRAMEREVFSRALKVSGSLDTSPLENRLETLMDK